MIKTSLAGSCMALAILLAAGPAQAMRSAMYVEVAPPPAQVEVLPPPRDGHVWVPGYWIWRHHHYVWVPGYWLRVRHGYRHYSPPVWVQEGNHWVWRPGVWVR
jgi:hypothetical protein